MKDLSEYKNPATIYWWQTLASTISEVLPILKSKFSGKNIYYPFLSTPVIINSIRNGFDKIIQNEFNRHSLRKSVYINSGYKGIWRVEKGDTTHNMLDGFIKNSPYIRDFILGGEISSNGLIDIKEVENLMKSVNIGLPDGLPTIVRLYSAESCLRSITKGGL